MELAKKNMRGLTCAALMALAAVAVAAMARTAQLAGAENALTAVYRKALYETCEYTESMAVDLNKLSVAGGSARAALLCDVIKQAQGAQANVSLLPLSADFTARAMKYINQTGDFAAVMLSRIASGGDITSDEYSDIAALSGAAARLSLSLSALLEDHEAAGVDLGEALAVLPGDEFAEPDVEYPTLLYDGPFSDGADGNEFRALADTREVTSKEAEALLAEFIGAQGISDMRCDGESSPGAACYEFSFDSAGRRMSAAVTKRGGRVLYLLSSAGQDEPGLSQARCLDIARAFMLSRGYGDMEISYFAVHGGVMTVNFAATQNGVILYPDLVKLQVSLEDGAVVGLEAGNYLRNHVRRALEIPAITDGQARMAVSGQLDVESVRLCVIPAPGGEKLCYEVSASNSSDTYLVYIDAMTGEQADIMQVVGDGNSTLVM